MTARGWQSLAVKTRWGSGQALFFQPPVQRAFTHAQVSGQFAAGAFESGQELVQVPAVGRRRQGWGEQRQGGAGRCKA